ncbi:hypothetical protein LUZ61_012077 [Rhynchospora tenuis]|uniref:Integrase catalytic domain-containing protein n=1 Tax=Rhynchospora tenuis TaxID=198213 RepID=A0AAD6F0S8_9POAL|nr:hypothetical protein LUZ61_012077 [Rhynchospora tenuis]
MATPPFSPLNFEQPSNSQAATGDSTTSATIHTQSVPVQPISHSIRAPSSFHGAVNSTNPFLSSSNYTIPSNNSTNPFLSSSNYTFPFSNSHLGNFRAPFPTPNFAVNPTENSTLPSNTSPMVFLTLPVHTKLSRSNFLAWRSQVEPLLHEYGLISFITSPPPSPSAINPATGQLQMHPDYLCWYKQDQMVLAWLRTSLSEQILAQVVSYSNSFDLWRYLTQSYSATSRARLTELKKKLQSVTKGSGSCEDFIQKIRAIADELSFIGSPLAEEDLVLAVLGGLGSEYNSFVMAVNSRAEPATFAEVQSLVLSHETLLQAQVPSTSLLPSSSNPSAFYAQNNNGFTRSNNSSRGGYRQNKGRGFSGRPPHNTSRGGGRSVSQSTAIHPPNSGQTGKVSTDTSSQDNNETCQICFKKGHTARVCWWRCDMRYTDDYNAPQAPSSFSGPPQAHVAQTSTPSTASPDWFLDSGATHHITSDINNLSSFEPYAGPDRLQIGDGQGMHISHIGSMDCLTSTVLLQAMVHNGLYNISAPQNCLPQALIGERVTADTWHLRFGHPSLATSRKILVNNALPCTSKDLHLCNDCNLAKSHKLPFSISSSVTHAPLDIIHADVWGPAPVVTSNGFKYYVIFIDDFTKFSWIFFLHSKDEVVTVFSRFKLQVENLFSSTIKILRTDGGTEFKPITRLFPQLVHQITCPYTPEQNGVAERKHRHVIELSLATISHASIPLTLWDEVFSSIVYLINRLPPSNSTDLSPYELLFQRSPNYLELRVLGSLCFPFTRPYNQHKLQPRSVACVFIGYAMSQKGYKCYHPSTGRIFVSRHVIFNEQVFPFRDSQEHSTITTPATSQQFLWTLPIPVSVAGPQHVPAEPTIVAEPTTSTEPATSSQRESPVGSDDLAQPTTPLSPSGSTESTQVSQRVSNSNSPARLSDQITETVSSSSTASNLPSSTDNSMIPLSSTTVPSSSSNLNAHPMTTRSKDHTRRPRIFPDFAAYLTTVPAESDPMTFAQASKFPHWQQTMSKELHALAQNKTWVLVPPPSNHNVVGCKWIFKTKRHADGTIERYKARLVAKGFTQEEGVDYFDTFSPVIRPTTIRIVLSIAVSQKWPIRQLDINNAFLHGDLHETVYMHQPPGFSDAQFPSHVCLLKKAIYGLKQSPRAWFHTLSTALTEFGFHGSKFDPSLFVSHHDNQVLIVLVYVDDIIVTGNNHEGVSKLIHTLQHRFSLKDLGNLSFFLGIAVQPCRDGILLTQKQYVLDLLCRTHMTNAQPVSTPMAVNTSLSKFDGDPFHDPKLYRAVVGALQYVTITRPDITFPVNKCSQFMHSPTTMHWSAVKRILRYLKGSIDHGLQFKQASSLSLHAYSDSDWAGCPDDRRSTSAFCIYLGSNLISWSSKKQLTVSKSSTEAEYRSLALAGAELIWVQYILHELHIPISSTPVLWCDNIGATYLASNPMFHARTKHVEIDFHFIRERVVTKQLMIKFICSKDHIADGLTKGLTTARFLDIRHKLMVLPVPSA